MKGHLAEMMARHAVPGRLDWIGLRPARQAPLDIVEAAEMTEAGLVGDHGRPGKRAVTLIQAEHLTIIAAFAGHDWIVPERLRRNLVISGINLFGLRNGHVRIGGAVIELQGPCPPCSRMEAELGPGGYNAMRGHGGYNAMRGHGGWNASVVAPG